DYGTDEGGTAESSSSVLARLGRRPGCRVVRSSGAVSTGEPCATEQALAADEGAPSASGSTRASITPSRLKARRRRICDGEAISSAVVSALATGRIAALVTLNARDVRPVAEPSLGYQRTQTW